MKKFAAFLSFVILLFCFSSCTNLEDDMYPFYEVKVINQTSGWVKFSIVSDVITSYDADKFYDKDHTYIQSNTSLLKARPLAPVGTISDGYDISDTVCGLSKDRIYSAYIIFHTDVTSEKYINHLSLLINSDMTITLTPAGQILISY